MNNPVLSFLTELVVRFRAKSPLFFKIIQWVSIAVTLVTGLPVFLTYLGVENLPEWFTALQSKAAGIAAIVATFLAGLPVDTPPIEEGNKEVGGKTAEKIALPFTDQA